jgi:hypothetical protein
LVDRELVNPLYHKEDPVRDKERAVELRYKLDKNFYEKVLNRRSIRIMEGVEGVIWVIYEMK